MADTLFRESNIMPTQTSSQHTFILLVIEKLRKDAFSHFKHFLLLLQTGLLNLDCVWFAG